MDDKGYATFDNMVNETYEIANCRCNCTDANDFQYWPVVQYAVSTIHSNSNVEFD